MLVDGIIARFRLLWRDIWRRDGVESEMADEFQYHMELRAADLVRSGVAPDEAARRARHEFGLTELHALEAHRVRGLRGVDRIRFSWLDIKLGIRMLVRYPGLTIVGGVAIAFAIWVGASGFEFLKQMVDPSLPLRGGDRLVAIRLCGTAGPRDANADA